MKQTPHQSRRTSIKAVLFALITLIVFLSALDSQAQQSRKVPLEPPLQERYGRLIQQGTIILEKGKTFTFPDSAYILRVEKIGTVADRNEVFVKYKPSTVTPTTKKNFEREFFFQQTESFKNNRPAQSIRMVAGKYPVMVRYFWIPNRNTTKTRAMRAEYLRQPKQIKRASNTTAPKKKQ